VIYISKPKEDKNISKRILENLNLNLGNLIEVAQRVSNRKWM